MRPGRILYFIQVDWIVSHAHAIELEVVSCRYAVCRWYDLRKNADSITDTLWNVSLGPETLLPLAKIASAVLLAPLDQSDPESPFRVLVKPNQLVLWHPEPLYVLVRCVVNRECLSGSFCVVSG